jgi:uncharacterized membrane protein YvbJ
MFCRKCGNEVIDGDVFCGRCGQATNAVIAVNPQAAKTSVSRGALGVLLGMIALLILLYFVGNVGVDGVVIFALLILAVLVGVGAFRKHLH